MVPRAFNSRSTTTGASAREADGIGNRRDTLTNHGASIAEKLRHHAAGQRRRSRRQPGIAC